MRVTVALDLDDTLYLEREYVRSGIAAVSRWVEAHVGTTGFGVAATALWNAGLRIKLFDATLDQLDIEPTPALIDALVAEYRDHLPAINLAEDAATFLRDRGDLALALVTDGHRTGQRRKIEALGLDALGIDPLLCTDEWGAEYWKPHPRAFQTLQAAHSGSGHFIYVADNPAKDFVAPRLLGWHCVQINRPGAIHPRAAPSERHRADLEITSFAELTADRIGWLLATPAGGA